MKKAAIQYYWLNKFFVIHSENGPFVLKVNHVDEKEVSFYMLENRNIGIKSIAVFKEAINQNIIQPIKLD